MAVRRIPVYNRAGEVAHYQTVETPDHRVRFSRADWGRLPEWPDRAINRRPVKLDGQPVGDLYGLTFPGQPNPDRPTGFVFVSTDGKHDIDGIDRLESARVDIERAYTGWTA